MRVSRNSNLLLSYPKSGRTWIRAFMIHYESLTGCYREIVYKHNIFHNDPKRKRLLLVREPCDLLVSFYWHLKYRSRNRRKRGIDLKDIKSFIQSQHGAESLSKYWRQWLGSDADQLEIRYEDLFNCIWEEILEWFGIEIRKDFILEADKMCIFENLKNNLHLFKRHPFRKRFFAIEKGKLTTNPQNPEAHKFRRGKVGGYVDYLDEEDVEHIRSHVPEAARWYSSY